MVKSVKPTRTFAALVAELAERIVPAPFQARLNDLGLTRFRSCPKTPAWLAELEAHEDAEDLRLRNQPPPLEQ